MEICSSKGKHNVHNRRTHNSVRSSSLVSNRIWKKNLELVEKEKKISNRSMSFMFFRGATGPDRIELSGPGPARSRESNWTNELQHGHLPPPPPHIGPTRSIPSPDGRTDVTAWAQMGLFPVPIRRWAHQNYRNRTYEKCWKKCHQRNRPCRRRWQGPGFPYMCAFAEEEGFLEWFHFLLQCFDLPASILMKNL